VNTNRNSTDYVGIFGYLQTGGVLENFSVSGYIEGRNHVGAIVGYTNGGTVRNVYNTATVVGNTNVGGLVGNLYIGTLTTSFNLGEVRGVTNVGGIVGSTMRYASSQYQVNHSNNINNVYSAAKVSATGTVAGAIGYDNAARYSTASANTRTNIWYDITVTVNFDQLNGYKKPSSHYGTAYAITSEQLFTTSSLLSNSFELNDISSNYGYYPE